MKKCVPIFCLLWLVHFSFGWEPIFENSHKVITVGGTEFKSVKKNHYPSPNLLDYNGDGLLDLLIGVDDLNSNGALMYLENEGTGTNMLFNKRSFLQNDGSVKFTQPI